jgi:hypothetical protein
VLTELSNQELSSQRLNPQKQPQNLGNAKCMNIKGVISTIHAAGTASALWLIYVGFGAVAALMHILDALKTPLLISKQGLPNSPGFFFKPIGTNFFYTFRMKTESAATR